MTLAQAAIGSRSLLTQTLMVLGGSLCIALAAQVSVPMWPVPVTLQTLAILLVGLGFGARLGAVTVLAYLAQGAAGLPVFAGGMAGLAFFGPTAGFLLGFVALAWVAGLAAGRGLLVKTGAALLATVLLYIPGIAWPLAIAGAAGLDADWAGQGLGFYWTHFMAPFLAGDALKAVLAALIVSGGLKALRTRKG